jgi:hypothetical protein
MKAPSLAWLAWGLCLTSLTIITLGLALEAFNRLTAQQAIYLYPNGVVLAFCFPVVGLVIALRQPHNAIGWLFGIIGLCLALACAGAYAMYTLRVNPGALPGGVWVSWLVTWTFIPGYLLLPFLLLLFPNGRLLSPRWRWIGWLTLLGMLLYTLASAWSTWPRRGAALLPYFERGATDEITGGWALPILVNVATALSVSSFAASILAMILRFHRARGVERQQLKWFTSVIVLVAVLEALLIVLTSRNSVANSGLAFALILLQAVALVGLALAVALAILRYRLYDIDVVIRRTLVYSVLTAILAVAYFGSILLFQNFFLWLTGANSPLAIVASTLTIAGLFVPLRRRVQDLIDRRFYRRKYDAEQVLAEFSETVRSETNLEQLTAQLLAVVNETLQPVQASLWLRAPQNEVKK